MEFSIRFYRNFIEKAARKLDTRGFLIYNVYAKFEKRREVKNAEDYLQKVYDTATSELVKKVTYGYYGCADGYEESLYKTEGGLYFLYTNGGAESVYTEENIKRMSAAKAEEWKAQA